MTKTEMIADAIAYYDDIYASFMRGTATVEQLNAAADYADALLLEASDEPELVGEEEHDDFERGAEDMEHRARRIEAEREADLEAYWQQLEDEQKDGGR